MTTLTDTLIDVDVLLEDSWTAYERRKLLTVFGSSILGAAFLAACGDDDEEASGGGSAAMRVFKHAKGEAEIPVTPKRFVILESTITHVMTLGAFPVGARNISRDRRANPELDSQFEGMVDFGGQELDIEQVVQLNPDLIIANSPGNDDIYERLKQIAPTVLYDTRPYDDPAFHWKERLRFYADVLDKKAKAEELISAYEARVSDFRSRMGARLGTTVVSVLRSSGNKFSICTKGGFLGSVLVDAGVRRPLSQDLFSRELPPNVGTNPGEIDISLERLREADGDVIFLWESSGSAEQEQANRANTAVLKAHPLWVQLDAVRQNRLYQVGGHWRGFSILEANKMLDDLFEHLL